MRREKYTFHGDVSTTIKKIETILIDIIECSNKDIKFISEKIDNNGMMYYPACLYLGNDDWASDITILVRKVNNSTTSIKLEDSRYSYNWRRGSMDECYDLWKEILKIICVKKVDTTE